MQPSPTLLAHLREELARQVPFDRMAPAAVEHFISHSEELYFAPGQAVVDPADGPVQHLYLVRRGAITVQRDGGAPAQGPFRHEAGELFPVEAALGQRAVGEHHASDDDTFLLALPLGAMRELAVMSPPFADFLHGHFLQFLQRSSTALQLGYASDILAQQSLETPLSQAAKSPAITCGPDTPLHTALGEMHRRRIGSILVTAGDGEPVGILTRHDVLGRIALAGLSLDTPVREVMSAPVHQLAADRTAQDAVLLMTRHGIRHVPVRAAAGEIFMVSERDLFGMQRTSARHAGAAVRAAEDVPSLAAAADGIRRLARSLLGQGVSARHATALVSQLNDALAIRLLELLAPQHGVDLQRACWLALGSEGRAEQTIVTDQDNALLLRDDAGANERHAFLAFGRAANQALDACRYPLCKGGVMAGEPGCCKSLHDWRAAFAGWIAHGSPEDLLNASIYFDFRPLAGDPRLASTLREEVLEAARRSPRFQKQLALNALQRTVPLDWRGGFDTGEDGTVDLKLRGAAIFVDAARLYALARGVAATNTRDRLEAVAPALGVSPAESQAWIGAFEFLQTLRLRVQLDPQAFGGAANRVAPAALNDLDRRTLKEAFRLARTLQRRVALDYSR